jgi:hypothetical protein
MSFSSERLMPQRPLSLPNDREITEITQSEIKRLRNLQDEGRLSMAEAELLETLQHDCRIHDF